MTFLALLDRLKRQRVRLRHPQASTSFGERRSRRRGAGLEYAESRPYRQGDDLRYLDPRVSMRTGDRYIREYHLEQRAAVQIILDTSASMGWKDAGKYALAATMARVFGFIGLISGDQVQVLSTRDGRPAPSPWYQAERRSQQLFDHLEGCALDRSASLGRLFSDAMPLLRPKALVVVISDFLDPDAPEALAGILATGRDLIAVHIVHSAEADPPLHPGAYTVSEIETGNGADLWVDAEILRIYREEFSAWQSRIHRAVKQQPGSLYLTFTAPFDGDWAAIENHIRPQLMPLGRSSPSTTG